MTILKNINRPITNNFQVYILLTLLFYIPEVIHALPLDRYIAGSLLESMPVCAFVSYMLCAIGEFVFWVTKRFSCKAIYVLVITSLVTIFSFVGVYIWLTFGLKYDSTAAGLVLQTNSGEATEFLSTYLNDWKFWMLLAGFLLFIIAVVWVCRIVMNVSKDRKGFHIIVSLFLVWSLYQFCGFLDILRHDTTMSTSDCLQTSHTRLLGNTFVAVDMTLKELKEQRCVVPNILNNLQDLRVDKKSVPLCEDIIVIVGESHIKKHMSLYGYKQRTNPMLESLKDSLFVFDDVIAPRNLTNMVFSEMLSIHSTGDGTVWYERPLWPALFKECGWNVTFYSNQFNKQEQAGKTAFSIEYVLNVPEIDEKCFNYHNTERYAYDGEFLDNIFGGEGENDLTMHNLAIYHFHGQHLDAAERYPHTERCFSASDYAYRTDLTETQKAELAHYDNACRYNDKQISRIVNHYKDRDAIIIYFSDHGENLYDVANQKGREYNLKKYGADMYRTQLEVPFLVYPTAKYRERHPEIIKLLKASVHRKFMTDDICHLLFYLSGVKTEWFNPERCLIHPKYNNNRHRILLNGEDYDEIVP